jgi:hypothetical protein
VLGSSLYVWLAGSGVFVLAADGKAVRAVGTALYCEGSTTKAEEGRASAIGNLPCYELRFQQPTHLSVPSNLFS